MTSLIVQVSSNNIATSQFFLTKFIFNDVDLIKEFRLILITHMIDSAICAS